MKQHILNILIASKVYTKVCDTMEGDWYIIEVGVFYVSICQTHEKVTTVFLF